MSTIADLSGRKALVTGAGHRLGRAIALGLAEAGADVVVHVAKSMKLGQETVSMIEEMGRRADLVSADLSDPAELEGLAEEAHDVLGGLDLVVLSAANFEPATLAETDAARWDKVFDLNLRAQVLLADRLGRKLGTGGRLVLIGDAAGFNLWRGYAAHSVAKRALHGAIPLLARELAPAVTVNGVAPGPVLFPAGYGEDAKAKIVDSTLLKRAGEPDDIVRAVLYLCGPGSYVTGTVLPVDGGRHLMGPA